MSKSQEMSTFLDGVSGRIFGRKRSECLKKSICVKCGTPDLLLKDGRSMDEYLISALCQSCQDEMFSLL
jgi:hypothetical protein